MHTSQPWNEMNKVSGGRLRHPVATPGRDVHDLDSRGALSKRLSLRFSFQSPFHRCVLVKENRKRKGREEEEEKKLITMSKFLRSIRHQGYGYGA